MVALLSTVQGALFRISRGLPADWLDAAAGSLASCWLWAGFTPLILYLAARFRLARRTWPGLLLLHVLIAVGLCLADVLIDMGIGALVPYLRTRSDSIVTEFLGQSFLNLFSYFVVLAIGHALHYHGLYLERQVAASRLEAQLLGAQIRALEMQLRPHFLYNTLHTVAGLVRAGRHGEAVATIAGFSDLLRASLRSDRPPEVPLHEELTFIERYLAIERIRFQDRLETRIAAASDSLDALVPTLILQPLVENAIRHGIERRSGPGRVEVEAERRNGTLVLRVRDSGPADASPPPVRAGAGIGLSNTQARLRHLYGDHQRFQLIDDAGGVLALVELPFHWTSVSDGDRPYPDR